MSANKNIYTKYVGHVFLNTLNRVEYKILKKEDNSYCTMQWYNSLLEIEKVIISYTQIENNVKSGAWILTNRKHLKIRKLILEKK